MIKIGADYYCVFYSFGYMQGVWSGWYRAIVDTVTPELDMDGVRLEITLKGDMAARFSTKKNIYTYQQSPHQILAHMAESNGYHYNVEKTQIEKTHNAPFSSDPQPRVYSSPKTTAKQFIEWTSKSAVNTEGSGGFLVYYDDLVSDEGLTEIPDNSMRGTLVAGTPSYLEFSDIRSYYFMRTKDSSVISFSPEFTGREKLRLGGVTHVKGVDSISNEIYQHALFGSNTEDIQTFFQAFFGVNPESLPIDKIFENHITRDISSAKENEVLAINRAKYESDRYYEGNQFKAEMQIVGDPTIRPMSWINVFVLKPDQTLHPTSGKYFIRGVSHEVSGGTFNTSLALQAQHLGFVFDEE